MPLKKKTEIVLMSPLQNIYSKHKIHSDLECCKDDIKKTFCPNETSLSMIGI